MNRRYAPSSRPDTARQTVALVALLWLAAGSPLAAPGAGIRAGAAEDEIAVDFGPRPIWLAGRGMRRAATYRHDPLLAEALYLDDGTVSVAFVGVDVIGLHHDGIERLRERLRRADVADHLFVLATHTHSAPDTLGAWGPDAGTSGTDPAFLAEVWRSIEASVRRAKRGRARARVAVASEHTGREGWVHRARPPAVVDDTLSVLFVDAARTGRRIGTVVNYAVHPESLAPPRDANAILRYGVSADFVHWLRAGLADHAPVVFANGAVASVNPDELPGDRDGEALAARLGGQLAERVRALEKAGTPVAAGPIVVRTKELRLPIENVRFVRAYCLGIFGDRPFYRRGGAEVVPRTEACDGTPAMDLATEVSLIDVGTLRLLALPGEIFAEFVVGYGRDDPDVPGIAPDDPCPPRLDRAPGGPFLRERLGRDGRTVFVLGLANDEIGYIVPEYDFVLDAERPYVDKPECGNHYHETNSLGPKTGELVLAAIEELLARR